MNTQIKITGVEMNKSTEVYLTDKISAISKYLKHIEIEEEKNGKKISNVSLWIELGKTSKHHKAGDVYFAELQLKAPGISLRIEETSDDLFKAVNLAEKKLKEEFSRLKDKKISQKRQ